MTRAERAFTLDAQFRQIRQALQAIASLSNRRRTERQSALMVFILQATAELESTFSASAEALTPTSAGADAPASQPKEDSEH
jgi:hypothetical protein